jgi:hypothetical protein
MEKSRKVKLYSVDEDVMLDMVSGMLGYDSISLPEFDLPEDAIVRGVQYRMERLAFCFLIESESFDEIKVGEQIPIADACWNTRAIKINKVNELESVDV